MNCVFDHVCLYLWSIKYTEHKNNKQIVKSTWILMYSLIHKIMFLVPPDTKPC